MHTPLPNRQTRSESLVAANAGLPLRTLRDGEGAASGEPAINGDRRPRSWWRSHPLRPRRVVELYRPHHRGIRDSWQEGNDTNALAAILEHGRPHQPLERLLARRVGSEQGLFRVTFDRCESAPAYVGEWHSPAYRMLSAVVDDLFAYGQLAPERRPYTEIAIWAAMHGLATLMVSGHLIRMPDDERDAAVARLTDMVVRGV